MVAGHATDASAIKCGVVFLPSQFFVSSLSSTFTVANQYSIESSSSFLHVFVTTITWRVEAGNQAAPKLFEQRAKDLRYPKEHRQSPSHLSVP